MNRISKHLQSLNRRLLFSMPVYAIFAALALLFGFQGTTYQDEKLMALIGLFLAAFLVLPRNAMPRTWPNATSTDEQDALDMLRGQLLALQNRATYMRFTYLGIGFLLIVMLPLLGV